MKNLLISLTTLYCLSAMSFTNLDGTSSHISGPNCWNGAMVATKVLKHKRFLGPLEWRYHLKHNCTEVISPDENSVGRIFNARDYSNEKAFYGEVHGFIHLDNRMVFAKHGQSNRDGYQIMTYEKMMKQYERSQKCRQTNDYSAKCFYDLAYYNCKGQALLHPMLVKFNKHLENLTFSQATRFKPGSKCTGSVFQAREHELKQMLQALQDYLSTEQRLDPTLEEALKESYLEQLYEVQVAMRSIRCKDRKRKEIVIREIRELLKASF